MGKKGSNNKGHNNNNNASNLPESCITLREESSGKRQTNVNAKSMLKLQHFNNLANWATRQGALPSLGAFFGHRLADCAQVLGTPADPSLFTCQSCESILQPGSNCTIRIEKNRKKVKRKRENSKLPSQNNVVYTCHFCSYRNLVRGTPSGHMKGLYPPKAKPLTKSKSASNKLPTTAMSGIGSLGNTKVSNKPEAVPVPKVMENVEVAVTVVPKDNEVTNSPATPLGKVGLTLLESKSKKRSRSKTKKTAESDRSSVVDAEKTVGASSKRRRKSWTSLKEKAEINEHVSRQNLTNLAIPFFM